MDRKIFNAPIRSETTVLFHPNTISLEEFCEFVSSGIKGYQENMEHIYRSKTEKDMFIETWFESFLAWCEVESE